MSNPLSSDVYQRITDQIIAAIEAGAGNWKMPWTHDGQTDTATPLNASSRRGYRGVNVIALWASAQAHGYPTGLWATYKQWSEMGAQVRKGERATLVVFWKPIVSVAGTEGDESDGDARGRTRLMARGFSVFNAAQVDGYTPPAAVERPAFERISAAESFVANLGADVRHGGARAFYRPADDFVQMPPAEAFRDQVAYYGTLAHELTHWTGHASRLDRDLRNRFGSEAYAAEELIAELGAAFICAELGIATEPRQDHASYIASWLKVLRDDKRAIFTASSRAQAAADWMNAKQEKLAEAA